MSEELILRARIDEISAEIALQKTVLKKLEQGRSLVQRQLNAVVDPVSRLPLEISSEIFLLSLAADPGPMAREKRLDPSLLSSFPKAGACRVPMLLMNVCNTWSDIALATPALWTAIRIDFPCASGLSRLVPIWFRRAKNHPLSITLGGDLSYLGSRVTTVIWKYGERLKHLEICEKEIHYEGNYSGEDSNAEIDLFGDMTPGPLSLLETLTIRTEKGNRVPFSSVKILKLLRLAPNLVECTFHMRLIDNFRRRKPVVHSGLRRLLIRGCARDGHILDCLSLPALETLSVQMEDISSGLTDSGLLYFLKRSAPPLQELNITLHSHYYGNEPYILQSLRLIPTLTRFGMCFPKSELLAAVFAALADSHSLLPNLRTLIIHLSNISESAWRQALRAASTRRSIHFDIYPSRRANPPEDVLAGFRELVADGVLIEVTGCILAVVL
ncbi:hypothetical protein DFH08DRAFT_906060 [Mycena albidolilacea]|uniref:F-box domain-containing protein n=1 Tax=Mycena albidolilacea TaxID=1033008 RepID=A0AAD7E7N9_9AGAR|nr:hypothetical protein DFH08DRAFT_906060 [Mycena albidolilacea]